MRHYNFCVFIIMCFVCVSSGENKNANIHYPHSNVITRANVKSSIERHKHKLEANIDWQQLKIAATQSSNNSPFTIKSNKPKFNIILAPNLKNRLRTDVEVIENVVDSQTIVIKDPFINTTHEQFNLGKPQRGNVIDWFLGLVGIRPPDPNPPPVIPVNNCPTCTCGQVLKHKRIVGGIETVINGYPWMTALMYNNRFYCGGSLINNKYVLTAAHCVNGFSREKLSVVFLDHDRSTSQETQTIMRKIKNVYRHSSYGHGGNYNNDIALLQLDQEVSVTGLLKPVCLPTVGKSFTGIDGIAVGWGATKEHGSVSNKLLEVTVPIISNIDCRKTGYGQRITDNMLCAGFPNGMKDSCQGDSGGPLHIANGTSLHIVGIVSWGEGCAKPNYPGVYTRVNRYVSWVKSNTRDACYC